MSRFAWTGALVLLTCLSACSDTSGDQAEMLARERPATEETSNSSARPDSLRDDFVQHGLAAEVDSRARSIAELGQPDSTKVLTVPSRYERAKSDSVVRFFYPGLELEYIVVGPAPVSEFLRRVVVADNKFLRYPQLGVGTRPELLKEALGTPWEQTDSTYTYDCGSCIGAETPVIFHIADGQVRRIQFSFYVD